MAVWFYVSYRVIGMRDTTRVLADENFSEGRDLREINYRARCTRQHIDTLIIRAVGKK